jgi:hypothetical protein
MIITGSCCSKNAAGTEPHVFVGSVCPKFGADYYVIIYTHHWELMKSVGSNGN